MVAGAGYPTTWVGVCVGAGLSEALVLSGVGRREWWQAQCCRNEGMQQFAGSNGEWSRLGVAARDKVLK